MTAPYRQLADQYRNALLDDVLPFWQRHSIDKECGGYFTCLSRNGEAFDTDKFVWLQARQVWTFSMLYNRLDKRTEWLDIARHGAEFLLDHGMDKDGNWYFALDRQGRPLVQPYNIFTDCFAAMALCQYSAACDNHRARDVAEKTYSGILRRFDNPKGIYSKAVPHTRPLLPFAMPMIASNLVLEMEGILGAEKALSEAMRYVEQVMGLFVDEDRGLVYEHVAPDGSHPDCFDGRLINPGHGIEGMWFVMDIAERTGAEELIGRAANMIARLLKLSWDEEYGGIYYFLDSQHKPPQQLEWSQKLWWAHLESLVACLKAYRLTGREEFWAWFERIHEYTWARFPDPQHGEWFGYLDRRGEPILDLKGGKWKGCFHVPRGLFLCCRELARLASEESNERSQRP